MNAIPRRVLVTGIRYRILALPLILIALAAGFFAWRASRSAYSCDPPPSGCTCGGIGGSCTYDGQCGGGTTACTCGGVNGCSCPAKCQSAGSNPCGGKVNCNCGGTGCSCSQRCPTKRNPCGGKGCVSSCSNNDCGCANRCKAASCHLAGQLCQSAGCGAVYCTINVCNYICLYPAHTPPIRSCGNPYYCRTAGCQAGNPSCSCGTICANVSPPCGGTNPCKCKPSGGSTVACGSSACSAICKLGSNPSGCSFCSGSSCCCRSTQSDQLKCGFCSGPGSPCVSYSQWGSCCRSNAHQAATCNGEESICYMFLKPHCYGTGSCIGKAPHLHVMDNWSEASCKYLSPTCSDSRSCVFWYTPAVGSGGCMPAPNGLNTPGIPPSCYFDVTSCACGD